MDNAGTWSNNTTHALDLYRAIPVAVLLGVIDFVTIFGNILVIVAVVATRSLRQMTCNYYIVSLAISDLGLGIFVLPFSSVYEILDYWIFPSYFCVIWLSIDVLSCTASVLNLLCISVDRYLAISRPLHYHNYSSPKFVFVMIVAAWILAFVISVAPYFGFDQGGESDQCKVAASGTFWALYSSVGSFFLPLTIMLFLYYRIYLVAAKHSKFMKEERERFASFATQRDQEADGCRTMSIDTGEPTTGRKSDHPRVSRVTIQSGGTPQGDYQIFPKDSVGQIQQGNVKKSTLMKKLRRMSKDKKAAKTLFIVMACFIGCWLPFFTVYLIDGVCKTACNIPEYIFKINFWLGYCNSMLNPVIYAASSHDFRTAFRKILRCSLNQTNSDNFGEMDQRTQLTGGGTGTAVLPNGLSKTANRLRHAVTSRLIKSRARTGNGAISPGTTLDRSQFHCVEGENYPLVVQQENGLKPITTAGQQGCEIANSTLEKDPKLSLGCSTTRPADDIPLVDSPKADQTTAKCPASSASAVPSPKQPPTSPINDALTTPSPLSPAGPMIYSLSAASGTGRETPESHPWNKVKIKTKQMVAVLADKIPNHGYPAKTDDMGAYNGIVQRIVQVADVGITTNGYPEMAEKGVQTSVSFIDLGLI